MFWPISMRGYFLAMPVWPFSLAKNICLEYSFGLWWVSVGANWLPDLNREIILGRWDIRFLFLKLLHRLKNGPRPTYLPVGCSRELNVQLILCFSVIKESIICFCCFQSYTGHLGHLVDFPAKWPTGRGQEFPPWIWARNFFLMIIRSLRWIPWSLVKKSVSFSKVLGLMLFR